MSTPPGGLPPYDPGHPAIGGVQAWLSTSVKDFPQGQAMILTIRVPNSTQTVVLSKEDAETWLRQIKQTVDQMSGIILAPPGFVVPPLHPNGQG